MARRIRWSRFLGNLLILACIAGFLFFFFLHNWLIPAESDPYRIAVSQYYYRELASSMLLGGVILTLLRFIFWLWGRAKAHPPARKRQQRRFKTWILAGFLSMLVALYFSSIHWLETYYAYLDSFQAVELPATFVGVTDQRVRITVNSSTVSYPWLVPPAEGIHFGDPVIVYKGIHTGRILVVPQP